ncbi:glycosyltransferase [Altererythrobacter ishigakiensis]|uniref:Cellulose synthase/poly-beta-1,6-N-acetylglucosamine synthase-like glycosyltransferase n=1 Tax=Altererythrobacter ishigakiensis TaxID=476157 RepID=A0A562USQ3_9SPHN|nr:glycosyltransferase [Altererythrobacter ishigakiensis]TWJ08628.1 cellulose synthase/poly-beta-1,6-N-acetylglucosamine synthase-like glycosyltransferase [Altererythrobacter ishigakiensis]
MNIVLFALFAIFFLLLIFPFTVYPCSLRLLRTMPIRAENAQPNLTATIIFSAFNEAGAVRKKVENIRRIRELTSNIDAMVYVDQSSDGSLEMWQAHPDVVRVVAASERTGKAVGMGKMARQANSDILICTDANVEMAPEAPAELLKCFADPDVGGVCGRLVYTNSRDSSMAQANSAYWRIEEFIKREEGRTGSTLGADGSIFAVRRSLYPDVPSHLLDDFIVSMSVVFAGKRFVSAPNALAYEQTAAKSSEEFRRKRRIACRAFSSHRHISKEVRSLPLLDQYKYYSHRWLRWNSGLWLSLSGIFGLAWIVSFAGAPTGLTVGAIGSLLLLLCLFGPKTFAQIGDIVLSFTATQLGVMDALRGRKYQTWQPPSDR